MDRIANIFTARKPLVIFTSIGYPTEEQSEQAVCAAIEKGADIIELGVPFSDPMADGPVISAASQVAIKEGMTLPKTIAFAARLRVKYPQTGLILFSYMNPLLHIGYDAVCQQLAEAGVDGILPVDLPLEERNELLAPARAHGLHVIPLVSPLTPEDRVAKIVEGMTGFVYYINVAGVTGARDTLPPEVTERIAMIKRYTSLPVAAGFGIASAAAAKAAANAADGVISGSGFVKATAISPQAAADFTAELLSGMGR
ncbi:MAG: tryptophan synthase subunit alpha [Lentisphaeria bacterium]|nr:tryptophan synthase subunit alpha [Lentisphaeria bacterium]